MAEGYLRYFAKGHFDIYSAGIETHGLNPRAVTVMQEDGIDISGHTSDLISKYQNIDFDYVITVCDQARTHCPQFAAKVKMIHHSFTDPAKVQGTEDEIMNAFRTTREQIKIYCRDFIEQMQETGLSIN
jgi:arsenate reductase